METTTTAKSYTLKSGASSHIEYGWVCPKCNRVNAPWKSTCDCFTNNNWQINWNVSDKTAIPNDWWKTYVTCTTADTKVGGSDYYDSTTGVYHN